MQEFLNGIVPLLPWQNLAVSECFIVRNQILHRLQPMMN